MASGAATLAPGSRPCCPPKRCEVSFRLVSSQDPAKILTAFRAWAEAQLPPDCRIEWHDAVEGAPASVMSIEDPAFEGRPHRPDRGMEPPRRLCRGRWLHPVAGYFKSILGMDAMLIGFGRDDDNIHSPNEKYDLESFHKGIRSWARILARIA